ncbi:Uncharacterised protein [Mycobacteroides abscessus subsp. abscessus]|nr:Uncharacterised protein [Mycobacteroides abscessus subsp. abscessus]
MADKYSRTADLISFADFPFRPVKNPFTSGCVYIYTDVAAATPEVIPAKSAAVQLGVSSVSANAVPMPKVKTPALIAVTASNEVILRLASMLIPPSAV